VDDITETAGTLTAAAKILKDHGAKSIRAAVSHCVLNEIAYERLKTIATNSDLGGGMAIAMKDLELRGAGNLLGAEQAGHIAGVGFDLDRTLTADERAARNSASSTAFEKYRFLERTVSTLR
jgi:RecG-like helicase